MNAKPCPMCSGDGVPLGALGRTMHYRCRNCGMQFSRTKPAPRARKAKS